MINFFSFFDSLGYRPFMMMLQSQVTLLDRFVIQQESIPNMLPPLGARHVPLQYVNRGPDVTNNISKNVDAKSIENFSFIYFADVSFLNFKL